jgi:PTS system nitrogen regulatory IIA component
MPHEQLNIQQAADYLHMDRRELEKLASRGRIPCRKVGGKFLFTLGELDHWVFEQMHELHPERLGKIEHGVSRHHGFDPSELLICDLIPEGGLDVPMKAKTRPSVVRELIGLAERADLVYNRGELIEAIDQREELCSTAIFPGVAVPHPRRPLPWDIAESFVVVGLTPRGIPYGAEDGSLTRLFFLTCCKDDRTHLHVLARLAQVLHEPAAEHELLAAENAEQLAAALLHRERLVLGRR